jgi:signal transduction histidine kinase
MTQLATQDHQPAIVAEQNRRILVVDDSQAIHDDFRKILTADISDTDFDASAAEMLGEPMPPKPLNDFELDFAFQGQEALELVRAAFEAGRRYAMAFIDVRMPPGWDGVETTLKLWEVDPDIQIVLCTAYSDYSWRQIGEIITTPERLLILKKPFDTIEVLQFARALTEKWSLLQAARRNADATQSRLVHATRHASMAEIATGVLHNVGNVLNSVNISTNLLSEEVRTMPAADLDRVVSLLREQGPDLGAFFTHDPRAPKVMEFLLRLVEVFTTSQAAQLEEVASLEKNVSHIKEIVALQQSYATMSGLTESLKIADLIDDTLRINDANFQRHHVRVVRDFAPDLPAVTTEKHKVLQILVNLVSNARAACKDSPGDDKQITVCVTHADGRIRVQVSDNGVGILPEHLNRIFSHGFTTKKEGHGFGLHNSANAARELGGSLTVHSDGPGHGAAFALDLPVLPPSN